MDLLKIAQLVQQFRQAVADKKIWLAISLAGQIMVSVAGLFAAYKPSSPITGRANLQAELDALSHPDHAHVVGVCGAAGTVQGIGGDLLAALVKQIIALLVSLLNWQPVVPAQATAPVVAGETIPAEAQAANPASPAPVESVAPADQAEPKAPAKKTTKPG